MAENGKRIQYLAGLRTGAPVVLGFIPVGIAYGVMARQAGLTVAQTGLMSMAVFAGASQMMAVGMVERGAGLVAIVVATFILNLRHLIMSTCVMDRMPRGNVGLKLLAAFGVTDESFALFTTEAEDHATVWFFLGVITGTWSAWVAGSFLGAAASNLLPDIVTASCAVALYAMFIGLLAPGLKGNGRLAALVVLTAVCNSLLSQLMAPSWALIASTLLCALLGVFFVDLDEKKEGSADEAR